MLPAMSNTSDAAELSSISSSLEGLLRRLTDIAGHYEGTNRDDLLAPLYGTERSIQAAIRSLWEAQRQLR